MFIYITILVERVTLMFSFKGIKRHSINREMFGTELLRVCWVFCRMKIFWIFC